MPSPICFFANKSIPCTLLMLAIGIAGSFASSVHAQSQEFIESSSPSKTGEGRVTSRFVPGSQIQTTVERAIGAPTQIAASPSLQNNRYPYPTNRVAATGSGTSQQNTALRTQQFATGSGTSQLNSAQRAQQLATGPTVGYAPDARPNLSQRPTQAALVAQNCVCNNSQGQQQFRNQQVVGTAPTLQLPQLQTPQIQNPQQLLAQPAQALTQPFANPTAAQPPQLSFPTVSPGQAQLQFPQPPVGSGQSIFQAPNIGVPQFGGGATLGSGSTFGSRIANWWRPLVSGTGAYVPVVRLQNMPPGVFVGQGIIGQPTAYADGQPIRNLFRYITP